MNKYLVLMIGALFSLLSCGTKGPEGDLVSLEFVSNGSRNGTEFEGHVVQDPNGTFTLTAMKMNYGPLFRKKIGKEEMATFKKIILDEKMYKYKEHYHPLLHVKDGYSWRFSAKFSDGSTIHSTGENSKPNGNGLSKIQGYLSDLIADATVEIEIEVRPQDLNKSQDSIGYHVK